MSLKVICLGRGLSTLSCKRRLEVCIGASRLLKIRARERKRECGVVARFSFLQLFSEQHPVRQIPNRRNPSTRIDGRSVSKKHSWNNVWEANNRFVTFFLQNFLETCTWESLLSRLKEIEKVRDLFIPKRRDKKGKQFGSIRFAMDINTKVVEDKLNSVWFDSYKLRANLSVFSREFARKKIPWRTHIPFWGEKQCVSKVEHVLHGSIWRGRINGQHRYQPQKMQRTFNVQHR